ncbi:hypothetical protein H7F33_16920 [Pedobacter sp. PAMC26386]|nr:hypothetical protein H7F33_16920 [Pedobacter sp. PAMC26386]
MNEQVEAILGNLYKQVKNRDQTVNYHAEIQIGGCAFEVLINDMPVYKYAGNDGSGSIGLSAPINNNILKSGPQTWEVRVFPPEVKGKRLTALPEGVKIELSVEALKFRTDGVDNVSEPVKLIETPKKDKDGKQIYADAGKPLMVYKGTFLAKVPYELKGWSESVDLSKEDEKKLKTELVLEYEKYRNWIGHNESVKIAQSLLSSEKETAQSLFYDKALNDEYIKTFNESWGRAGITMYPLENYKMVYSGNGKMVTLERIDHLYDPALAGWYILKKDSAEDRRLKTFYLNFHRPKTGAPLEVIR